MNTWILPVWSFRNQYFYEIQFFFPKYLNTWNLFVTLYCTNFLHSTLIYFMLINPRSAKPTKCSNTIKTILLGWCLKGNTMSNNFQTKCKLTGNYRTLSSIIDKAFCENSLRSKSVYCFHEKIHLRRVTGPWSCL